MKFMIFPVLAFSSSFVISSSIYAEQAAQFSLKSSSFTDRGTIPSLYTCDGRDLSPQLTWRGAPARTESYVMICDDPDAPSGTWYHWVLYNIPRSVSQIPQGAGRVVGADVGQNSWGRTQYNGPCPPGSSIHRYNFTLYALDTRLALPAGADAKTVLKAIQGHVLSKTIMLGVFGR
jgi:Raf kinase inhibitor-like YbhB/YbcL family protein